MALMLWPASVQAQESSFDPYSTPLTFEAAVAGATVSFRLASGVHEINFSRDGTNWIPFNYGFNDDHTISIQLDNVGDKVAFKGSNAFYGSTSEESSCHISCTEDCYVYGNIMSLISTSYTNVISFGGINNNLSYLFYNNEHLLSHPTKDLVLPATSLSKSCYKGMFYHCTNLTRAPELPTTELIQAENCYESMFEGCTSLTKAPVLPATILNNDCYKRMFFGCSNLSYVDCYAPYAPSDNYDYYIYMYNSYMQNWLNGVSATGVSINHTDNDISKYIPAGWTTLKYQEVNSWSALKTAMESNNYIKLTGNCTDPDKTSSSYLAVPSGKTVILNLNGKTINRGLTRNTINGYVIKNEGTLTIKDTDTGGTIRGGHNHAENFCAGIYNTGTLTINSGTISNNNGHGIVNTNTGTLTINGGTISNNGYSGIENSGTLYLYGGTITLNSKGLNTSTDVHIKGTINISNNSGGIYQLYLSTSNNVMIVDGTLTGCSVGIFAVGYPRVITSGFSGKGDVSNFFWSDGSSGGIRLHKSGEAAAKKSISSSLVLAMPGWTYGEAASEPNITEGNTGNGDIAYTYKAEGQSEYSETKPINAGTHTVKATIAETDFYLNGEKTKNYTVAKATLTISEATATAEYGTQVKDIPISATVSLGGTTVAGTWAFPSDNTTVPSVSSTTAYTATFTPTTGAGNYNALTTNITPTITQKAVTINGITASNKTYDGSTTAALDYSNATLAGKVGGDDLSVSATGQFANKDVGTGKTVTISNLTLGGASAGNYKLADSGQQETTTANITQKAVTVSGITASNKTYNGNTEASLGVSGATISDLISGDNVTLSSATGQFDDANVGTGKTVAISGLTLSGESANNYTIASSSQATTIADITPRPLAITGITASNKTYDGSTTATVDGTGANLDGLIPGDDLTLTYTGAFDNAIVGTGKTVTVNANISGGEDAGNYQVASCNSPTADITPKALTISAKDKTITYGDAPANDGVTYSGFTGTDDETVLGGTLAYDYSYAQYDDVGDDYTITPKGLTSNNYTITFANGTLTVNPKAATVTPEDGQGKTYGEDDTTLTYSSTGLVNGDVFTGALSRAAGENVGTYAITQGTIANANYNITFTTGKTFKIDPKTVGITWGETLLTYSGAAQAPEATATGLEDGDDCHVIVTGAKTEVGSYTATASSLDNANYKLPATGLTTDYEIVDQLVLAFAADQQWATWYGVNNYQVPDGMKAYKVTAVSDTKVTVDAINYIPAMTGVLLYREATEAATAKSNAYTGATSSITSLLKSGSPTPYKDYILYGNQFVLSAVSEIGAHRCYLPATGASGSRSLDIDTGDGTTGIYFGYQDASEYDRWHDLQGNRIEKPQKKGLYILNGKKVVVK